MPKHKTDSIALFIILGLMFGVATVLWVSTMATADQTGTDVKLAGIQMTYAVVMGIGGFLGIMSILAFAGAGFMAVGKYASLLSIGGGRSRRSRW